MTTTSISASSPTPATTRVGLTVEVGIGPGSVARQGTRLAAGLAVALAVDVIATCLLTLLDPGLLAGPAAMRGSAVGTALVVLTTAVPLLLVSVAAARRGSALAVLGWLGALAMIGYNALMFLFATPFNRLFPLYVGCLGLTVWSAGTLVTGIDERDLAGRFGARVPRRGIAAYIWVTVTLNALLWLTRIVPALVHGGPAAFLRGTGLTTNVVFVQDLGLWLPLMAVVGWWLWSDRPGGLVLGAAGLLMWCLESVSIAVDQAYGAAFDPASTVVSASLTPVFVVLSLVGTVPILLLLRGFDREGLPAKALRVVPPAARLSVYGWALAVTAMLVGLSAMYGGVTLARNTWKMPISWLSGTPFTGWAIPGLALVVGVAVPQLVTAAAVVRGWSFARLVAMGSGVLLVVWIVVQLLVLQQLFFLQPVIAVVGVIEIWLVGAWAGVEVAP